MPFLKKLTLTGLPIFFLLTEISFAVDIVVNNETELQNALNSASSGDRILLNQSGTVTTNISINGPLNGTASGFTLDGGIVGQQTGTITGANGSFYYINMGNNAINSIKNIEINDGASTTNSVAGAFTASDITGAIENSAFRRNTTTSTTGGGGIYISGSMTGNITKNIHFDTNKALAGSGGGLYVNGDFLGVIDGTGGDVHFDSNTAAQDGGDMYVSGDFGSSSAPSRIYATYFATGRAEGGSGGGLYVGGAFTGNIGQYAFFDRNYAAQDGGGLYVTGALTTNINLSWFSDNQAGGNGAGLYADTFTGNINSAFLRNNISGGSGGAIYLAGSATGPGSAALSGGVIENSSFEDNQAAADGGAIYIGNNSDWLGIGTSANGGNGDLRNSQFMKNKAGGNGGAISVTGDMQLDLNRDNFISNQAIGGNGGAIHAQSFTGSISNSSFTSNSAGGDGGAIHLSKGTTMEFHNTKFDGNTATGLGGGIYFGSTAGTDYNVIFAADEKGQETSFTNNTDSMGQNSFHVEGTAANANFNLSITGAGTVALYDPFRVDIGASAFSMTMSDPNATLVMSGENNITTNGGTSSLNFTSGLTRVVRDSGDFTLRILGNTTSNFTWGANNILTIETIEDRDNTLPLIDLTGATGHKTFIVENGATLDITRILKPLPDNRYLLVAGLEAGSTVQVGEITYLRPDGYTKIPVFENNGTEIWLDDIQVPDAFDPDVVSPNLVAGEMCITDWLNYTKNGLALTPSEVLALRRDFHSAPPEAAVSMSLVGMDIHNNAASAARAGFLDRGAASMHQGESRFWFNYIGADSHTRDRNMFSGYNVHTNGALLGAVWEHSPVFNWGGYVGYSQSNTNFRYISADADSKSAHIGLQASYLTPWGARITADGNYSHHSVDMKRSPGGFANDTSDFDQNIVGTALEIAYDVPLAEKTRLTPTAAVSANWIWQDAIRERGKVMAARVKKVEGSSVASYLGVTLERDFIIENDVKAVTPGVSIGWKHQYTGRQRSANYSFVDSSCDYRCTVMSRELGADSLQFSGYVTGTIRTQNAKWSFRAGYGLEAGKKSLDHTFYAGMIVSF